MKIRILKAACLLGALVNLLMSSVAVGQVSVGSIVKYEVIGGDGLHDSVPVTFGSLFVSGDVPAGSSVSAYDDNGKSLPTQVDAKARNEDGSLRHAVVTVVVPRLEDSQSLSLMLRRSAPQPNVPIDVTALPRSLDAVVQLVEKERTLKASLAQILATAKPEPWLSGPLVSEWWVSGPFRDAQGYADPHLAARFGIRSYGRGRPLRIEVNVENDWTWVPGPAAAFYDASVTVAGKKVFSKLGMMQQPQTRWRKVFWLDTPVDVYVKQELANLKRARVIPNYEEGLPGIGDQVSRLWAQFLDSAHEPMDVGIMNAYMPTTGGRPDIALLPAWTVLYLLTQDKRAYDVMIASGELSGSYTSHYRNERTGRPSTSEEFPNISTHSNFVGRPGNLPKPDSGGVKNPNIPQAAHEPSLAFIPYLVTGDRYFLEELEFWSQWNSWGTSPEYRHFKDNLFVWDELRAQAWSLRTLAQAAYIAPDDDPIKPVLVRELRANFSFYDKEYTNNPNASVLHTLMKPSTKAGEYSPWMDDYLTSALNYIVQMGFEFARPFATWKAKFPVQRMINPEWCWIVATPYRIIGQNQDGSLAISWADAYRYTLLFATKQEPPAKLECNSGEMANYLRLKGTGEMMGGAEFGGGYPAILQPALAAAIDLNVPGAGAAWRKFQQRIVRPAAGFDPQWAILPWNSR